jgi:hypothetical protein
MGQTKIGSRFRHKAQEVVTTKHPTPNPPPQGYSEGFREQVARQALNPPSATLRRGRRPIEDSPWRTLN